MKRISKVKLQNIHYSPLEIQEYLMIGNKNNEISKVIFKTRGGTLDIKINEKWKYEDITCVGCDKKH